MPRQTNPGDSRPSSGPEAGGRPQSEIQGISHDSLFKKIFGVPENAASQLRAVLPPDLTKRLDLDKLVPVPGTFVDEALQQRHTDVLFTAPLDGQDALVYVLLEHQSKSDPLMAYRMLRYVTRIWDRYLDRNPGARRLPAVIPLVVYNGRRPWSAPRRLEDLVDPGPGDGLETAEYLPRFSFLLDDLAALGRDRLRDRDLVPGARVTLVLLRDAPANPEVDQVLQAYDDDVRGAVNGPGGMETLKVWVAYILGVSDTPESRLRPWAASLGPDAQEAYMTTAEMLEVRGEARMLARVLSAKFGPLPGSASLKVSKATAAQLEQWGSRVGTAATLDEVFDSPDEPDTTGPQGP